MLILRRQAGESFRVGEQVEVRVLSIGRGQVKIGVIAPPEVEIYRTELGEINRRAAGGWRPEHLQSLARKLQK